MPSTDDKYFECPACGWAISFHLAYDESKYISLCPFCRNELEIDKEVYENNANDGIEFYFEFEKE